MKRIITIFIILLFVAQSFSAEKMNNLYLFAPGAGLVFVGAWELKDADKLSNETGSDVMIAARQVAGVGLIAVGAYLIVKSLTPVSVEDRIQISATPQKITLSIFL